MHEQHGEEVTRKTTQKPIRSPQGGNNLPCGLLLCVMVNVDHESDCAEIPMIFLQTLNTAENQLPAIIFTQPEDKRKTMPVITDLGKLPMISPFPPPKLNLQGLNLPVPKELPKAEDGMKKGKRRQILFPFLTKKNQNSIMTFSTGSGRLSAIYMASSNCSMG